MTLPRSVWNLNVQLVFFISSLCSLLITHTKLLSLLKDMRKTQEKLLDLMVEPSTSTKSSRKMSGYKKRSKSKRKVWKMPGRTEIWWSNLISGVMPREEFTKNLRIDINLFGKLCDELEEILEPSQESFRTDTITVEKRVAMVLYYLKDQGSLRMTANTFGVSVATVSISLRLVCDAICKLGPQYIQFPTEIEDVKALTSRFENKFGMPQAIGCIDGTHIPIQKPHEDPHDFFCYKMKYSLNCQAICDEKGIFLDVEVKWPGSVHDARVYANSNINKRFRLKQIPQPNQELVPGYAAVPPFLLGDPAYPLLPNVMEEFPTCRTDKEELFNNTLRSARNQIECAFGRLKARWRILNRTLDIDLDFATTMIYACFILHNFCELNNADINQEILERRMQACSHHKNIDKLHTYNSSRGKAVRDSVAQYLYDNLE